MKNHTHDVIKVLFSLLPHMSKNLLFVMVRAGYSRFAGYSDVHFTKLVLLCIAFSTILLKLIIIELITIDKISLMTYPVLQSMYNHVINLLL